MASFLGRLSPCSAQVNTSSSRFMHNKMKECVYPQTFHFFLVLWVGFSPMLIPELISGDFGDVSFPLARPESHANFLRLSLTQNVNYKWRNGVCPRENQEAIRKEKKWNPGQSQTTDVHCHFHIIILLGPSALVSNADMIMRWFSHLHLPTCCFLCPCYSIPPILLSFQRLSLRSAPCILEALRDLLISLKYMLVNLSFFNIYNFCHISLWRVYLHLCNNSEPRDGG